MQVETFSKENVGGRDCFNPLQSSDALWHHTFASRQKIALNLHLWIRRKYEMQQK